MNAKLALLLLALICLTSISQSLTASVSAAANVDDITEADTLNYIRLIEDRALQQYLSQRHYLTVEDVPDRIVGGVDAAQGEAPFQAQLFRRFLWQNRFLCGGSLISSRTVLSAGHCVSYFFNYRIRYGSNSRLESPYPDMELAKIKLHPKFNLDTVQNDIALFIMKQDVQPSANVRTIDLQREPLQVNTTLKLFGFGLTNGVGNSPASKLQKTELQLIADDECEEYIQKLGINKTVGMLCASAPERSACNGDSGGPLVVASTGLQAGVVSFGTRFCPPGSINVYTNVSHYIDWITDNIDA